MNDPYEERRPALKAEIVARVGAGETVKDICAGPGPGLPSAATVERWAEADPAFGEALAAARGRARARRDAYDPLRAQAVLDRLSTGETIEAVLADPAMPSRRLYRAWLADQAPFAEAVHRFRLARAEARTLRLRNRRRAFDQTVADRIIVRTSRGEPLRRMLAADPALPSLAVVARWRREQPDFDVALRIIGRVQSARGRRAVTYTPDLRVRIVTRVREGASLVELGREAGMPCARTLYKWLKSRPEFAAEVSWAREDRKVADDGLVRLAEAVTPDMRTEGSVAIERVARLRRRGGLKIQEASKPRPT